jgi:FixJ family two-component response regulator
MEMRHVNVVVVEDDAGMRHAIVRILSVAGMASTSFPSAEELLESNSMETADALVADIRLPGMSGLNMVRELDKRGISRPVIFITSHDEQAVRNEARSLGARDFLPKPFLGTTLLESLRQIDNNTKQSNPSVGSETNS